MVWLNWVSFRSEVQVPGPPFLHGLDCALPLRGRMGCSGSIQFIRLPQRLCSTLDCQLVTQEYAHRQKDSRISIAYYCVQSGWPAKEHIPPLLLRPQFQSRREKGGRNLCGKKREKQKMGADTQIYIPQGLGETTHPKCPHNSRRSANKKKENSYARTYHEGQLSPS
ncbi:hypothetical protein MPH_04834 [Macrophomina phaseolina MS6]|uniref:Uncharacterized protein n=1 Tax=Macrophomina phaseolina (strain MS6) TaxID=1126212 RepID=K2SM91_MACPH|nr:hypothetical protein MPH_04834 [Macrophomina phaseolina MS6]